MQFRVLPSQEHHLVLVYSKRCSVPPGGIGRLVATNQTASWRPTWVSQRVVGTAAGLAPRSLPSTWLHGVALPRSGITPLPGPAVSHAHIAQRRRANVRTREAASASVSAIEFSRAFRTLPWVDVPGAPPRSWSLSVRMRVDVFQTAVSPSWLQWLG